MEPLLITLNLYFGWAWLVACSGALALVPALLLAAIFVAIGWWYGWGWRALYLAALGPLLVAGIAWGMGQNISPNAQPRAATTTLRVAHLNAFIGADNVQPKLDFITRSNAEVVSIVEASLILQPRLTEVSSTYPYQAGTTHWLGLRLLSKWPMLVAQKINDRALLYHVARPANLGGAFYVLQVHPHSPYRPRAASARAAHWQAIHQALPTLPKPLIVVGDFNTVPWDTALRPLPASGLTMAGGWRAYLPTFPSFMPIVPIDLLFSSASLPVTQLQRVRVAATDHLGFVADFTEVRQ